ncbi:MAG: hypothetical protein IKS55_12120 [Oscillospiraceae bacterium]|nr:hypothetical protein [Oscillospiraceae bacterium]
MKKISHIFLLTLLLLLVSAYTGITVLAEEDTPDLPFMVQNQEVSASTESLNLGYATQEEISQVISVLPSLTNLRTLILGFAPAEDPLVSWEQIRSIQEVRPDLKIEYPFSIRGYRFQLEDEVLNLSHISFEDEGAFAVQVASCMPNLKILDMDSCGVSDESMANIRERFPDVEVIWRVYFGPAYSARTNVERLLMSNPDRNSTPFDDEAVKGLYYCTKVKYLDIGHMSFVTDAGWAANMPDLEVLIIAMTAIKDISALANCPKLNYLEFQTSGACDLRPLSELKKLKDLNICYDFALRDIRPIYDLDLNRLWIGCLTPIPREQIVEYQKRHPNCEVNTTTENPTEEEWRIRSDIYPPTAVDRYEQLYQEFQYGSFPACYAYNENDPYYYMRIEYPLNP